ncbi:MAG: response regulator [Deltaproteobacteria bacterium]|nr:response regulator [Deltaproteobacteria bacterium]
MTEPTTKILFAGDEKITATAVRRLLENEEWECCFVHSADQALEILAKEPIGLLVTDAVIPETDGIALLSEVKQRYPNVIRILLTGPAGHEQVTRALTEGYAQQIIPKPWIDQEFKEIIHSALRQKTQQQKYGQKFQALINSIPLLPALPENYSQVQGCISADEVDIEKMAAIISLDVALTSTLLHWANSALFGQRFRVDCIKKALVVLGTDIVISLILSEAVSQSVAGSIPPIDGFELNNFKNHSITTAIIARLLIKSLHSADNEQQDRAFIAGLLHDIGKLVAAKYFRVQFAAALKHAAQQDCPLHAAETEIMGVAHTELGSYLAEWWALPHFIANTIQLHHRPETSPVEPEVINAVYLANQLSYRFGYGCNGEKIERQIEQKLWDRFYLSGEGLEILQIEAETVMQVLCEV